MARWLFEREPQVSPRPPVVRARFKCLSRADFRFRRAHELAVVASSMARFANRGTIFQSARALGAAVSRAPHGARVG